MATPVQWQSKFQVNTGSAATGTQSKPKIIGLDNGDVLVVWIENAAGQVSASAGKNIVGMVYNSEGVVVVPPKALATSFSGMNETDFDIAPTNNFGFVVAFIGESISSPNNSSVIHARFDANINLLNSGALESETTAPESYDDVSIAYDHLSDRSIVTFTKTESGGDTDIFAYSVVSSGVSGISTNLSDSGNPDSVSDVAILSDGNYAALFQTIEAVNNDPINAGVFTPAGVKQSGINGVSSPGNVTTNPAVASFKGGGHVVAVQNGANISVFLTPANTAFTSVTTFTVDDNSTGPSSDPQVVVLPDGDFVVAWRDASAINALRARRYNPDGSEDGGIMDVSLTDSGLLPAETSDVHMSATADGRILFAWIDEESDEVFASIFDPRGSVIKVSDFQTNSTNFIETFDVIGRPNGGTIKGDSNDNILIGLGGKDKLNGAADDDILIGGGGNDRLNGGTGADEMEGGKGNDTYIVDNTGDTVSESGGSGTDTVKSSVSFKLGTGLEKLLLTGSGNINATGNDANNTLVGNGGRNTLKGNGGSDKLKGGGDVDKLLGGAGKDNLNGGNGNDILQGDAGNDRIIGGGGKDMAVYSGKMNKYTVTKVGNKIKVADKSGTDVVSGVEKLKFGNTVVTIKQALKKTAQDAEADIFGSQTTKATPTRETVEFDPDTVFAETWLSGAGDWLF